MAVFNSLYLLALLSPILFGAVLLALVRIHLYGQLLLVELCEDVCIELQAALYYGLYSDMRIFDEPSTAPLLMYTA